MRGSRSSSSIFIFFSIPEHQSFLYNPSHITYCYIEQNASSTSYSNKSHKLKWQPTSIEEFEALLDLQIAMGLFKKSSSELLGNY